jgi:hypothetical protein
VLAEVAVDRPGVAIPEALDRHEQHGVPFSIIAQPDGAGDVAGRARAG